MLIEPPFAIKDRDLRPEIPTSPLQGLSPDPALLLPLVALALVIFFPILEKGSKRVISSSLRHHQWREKLIGRLTVIVLPLAALVSMVWPLWPDPQFGRLWQALAICAVALLPLFTWHAVLTRRQPVSASVRRYTAASRRADELNIVDSRIVGTAAGGSDVAPVFDEHGTSGTLAIAAKGTAVRVTDEDRARAEETKRAEEAEIDAQLVRLETLVDSHDLGEPDRSFTPRVPPSPRAGETGAHAVAPSPAPTKATTRPGGSSEVVPAGDDPKTLNAVAQELRGMNGGQIVRLVSGLRTDRRRLQKLAIAQRAANASERRAHERTRSVARDAVRLVRTTREFQRLAEKTARRERRERYRAEERYERIARALHNAASILEPDDGMRTNGATEPKARIKVNEVRASAVAPPS